jgi:hypothetical protein
MQNTAQLLDTRELLQTAHKVVKQIAFGAGQCYDYECMLREAQGVTKVDAGGKSYKVGSVFSRCYTLRKEGYEDLQVADWGGCSMGIGSVDVGCATQKGYKAWRALLRSY